MNVQHFLTAKHIADAKGYKLLEPVKTDMGYEVSLEKDGSVPFTGISDDPDRAIQLCLNHL